MRQGLEGRSLKFPQDRWARVSSDAKDLVSKLLQVEPSKRLDTFAIEHHPWIKGKKSPLLSSSSSSSSIPLNATPYPSTSGFGQTPEFDEPLPVPSPLAKSNNKRKKDDEKKSLEEEEVAPKYARGKRQKQTAATNS